MLATICTVVSKPFFDLFPFLTGQGVWQRLLPSRPALMLKDMNCIQFFLWLFRCPLSQARQFFSVVAFCLVVIAIPFADFFKVLLAIPGLLFSNFVIVQLVIPMRERKVMFLVSFVIQLTAFILFFAALFPSGTVALALFFGVLVIAPYSIAGFAQPTRANWLTLSALGTIDQFLSVLNRPKVRVALLAKPVSKMRFLLLTMFAYHSCIIPPSPVVSIW